MMNPIGAALSAAISLFAVAKQKLDQWNAAMDEASKQAADATFQSGIMAKKEAMHQAAIAQAEFIEGLKAMQAGQDGVTKKLEASISKWHDYAAAQTEVNNAQEAAQLERINLQEKLGKITPEQGILSRAAVRQGFERAADNLKKRTEQNELAAKQAELDNARVAGPQLLAQQADAAKNAAAITGRLKQQQADFQKLVGVGGTTGKPVEGSMLANAIADAAAKNKELEDLQFHGIPLAGPGIMRGKEQAAQAAQEQVAMLRANAQKFQDAMDKISGEQLPLAQQAAKTAAEKVTSNESRRLSLTDEIEKMRASQMTAQRARGITAGLKSETESADTFSQLASTDLGKLIVEGSNEAHIIRAGRAAQTAKDMGRPLPGGDKMISAAQALAENQNNVVNQLAGYLKKGDQSWDQFLGMVRVPSSNSMKDFMIAIGKALGIECNFSSGTTGLREKIDYILEHCGPMLVFDECSFLIPRIYVHTSSPPRLEWVRDKIIDRGLPVVLASTPVKWKSDIARFIKKTGYTLEEFFRRNFLVVSLPSALSEADMVAAAQIHFSELDEDALGLIANEARLSTNYLQAVEAISKRARFLAKGKRIGLAIIERAIGDVLPGRADKAAQSSIQISKPLKASFRTPEKHICERSSLRGTVPETRVAELITADS